MPVLRVDHVTLERILPRVWEIVSSGVPMVKRCNGAKVYLHSDSIRASDPVRDCWPYKENPLCPSVAARWRYTSGIIVRDQPGVSGFETTTFSQRAKTRRRI